MTEHTPSAKGLALFDKCLADFERNPERHDQGVFLKRASSYTEFDRENVINRNDSDPNFCGTACCLAGDAVLNSPDVYTVTWKHKHFDERGNYFSSLNTKHTDCLPDCPGGEWGGDWSFRVLRVATQFTSEYEQDDIAEAARILLDLDNWQADVIFGASNTLDDLKEFRRRLEAGVPLEDPYDDEEYDYGVAYAESSEEAE